MRPSNLKKMNEVSKIDYFWDNAKHWMTREEWAPLGSRAVQELIAKRMAEKSQITAAAASMRKIAFEAQKQYEETHFNKIVSLILKKAYARGFSLATSLPVDIADVLIARLVKEGYSVKQNIRGSIEISWE